MDGLTLRDPAAAGHWAVKKSYTGWISVLRFVDGGILRFSGSCFVCNLVSARQPSKTEERLMKVRLVGHFMGLAVAGAGWRASDSSSRYANISLHDPCGFLFERNQTA